MVSIVIPAFNAENYIEECIHSIEKSNESQTGCYEILIVDDGSKDSTYEKCLDLSKQFENIRVIHQENQGVSKARQNGIKEARGTWIVFVDADDIILDGFVDEVENEEECQWIVFGKSIGKPRTQIVASDKDKIIAAILRQTEEPAYKNSRLNTVWSKAYQRSILLEKRVQFPAEIHHGEDMLYNLDYVEYCVKIRFVNKGIYRLRKNSASATHRFQPQCVRNDKLFLDELSSRIEKRDSEALKKIIYTLSLNGVWIALGQYFCNRGNPKKTNELASELKEMCNSEPYRTAIRKKLGLINNIYKKPFYILMKCKLYLLTITLVKKLPTKKMDIMDEYEDI